MSISVLFVDDELLYRTLYGDAMKAASFDVRFADNGENALKQIEVNKPDILVVDCIMPIMTGMALLKKIKRRKIPSIVLTTLEGETDREDALALGAKGFYSKNEVDPLMLIDKIKTILKA